MADGRSQGGLPFSFQLELVTTSGRRRMQLVDSFYQSKDTWDWPVWRKSAPVGMRYRVSHGTKTHFDVKRK